VRRNRISHCEQAGIVGSLGCSFSRIVENTIHDIHVRCLFSGAEMAGIKFHGAIDTEIAHNRLHRTVRGIWLDWMSQGTRVSRNVFHGSLSEDLFLEVNHGPCVVDNNLFLSETSLLDVSEGSAFVHNIFAGRILFRPEPARDTPYHPPSSTTMAGLAATRGGDNRYRANLFFGIGPHPGDVSRPSDWKGSTPGYGLHIYAAAGFPSFVADNIHAHGARPGTDEAAPALDEELRLTVHAEANGQLVLTLSHPLERRASTRVGTADLGQARVPDLPYHDVAGRPFVIDSDFFGQPRGEHPILGPFELTTWNIVLPPL
jgi:hypothetical protein